MGRAIVERLLRDGGSVVAVERDAVALGWAEGHPAGPRLIPVVGDASDEAVAGGAADLAERAGAFAGWVNNAAVFRDASLHSAPAREVLDLLTLNLGLAVVGSATAVERSPAAGEGGAIVNVSSHPARRAAPGALPYATAKAAIEGLTRAMAVDYGPFGIRTSAVALGSVVTGRYEALLEEQDAAEAARIEGEMRRLHPLGAARGGGVPRRPSPLRGGELYQRHPWTGAVRFGAGSRVQARRDLAGLTSPRDKQAPSVA